LGLAIGPWLRELKRAALEGRPDEYPIRIDVRSTTSELHELPLGRLREVLTITPGQKIAYVTDAADTVSNREAMVELARSADLLFIEAAFAQADGALAAERAHLTTAAAGQIGREAGVRRIEPFHFSARYEGEDVRMLSEAMAAFAGQPP
jgi:ribonuclease Z